MIFKFAFRNVLRHKKRSFLTALSIFFAAIIVGFAQGWVNGIVGVYTENFAKYQTGHVRITTEEFTKREKFMPVDEYMYNPESVIKNIKKIEGIRSVRERIRFGILLGNKETTVEAVGMGLDLKNNELNLKKKIVKGKISDSGIYIGDQLAKNIGVKLGEELLIATKTSEGGLNGIKLRVEGIFKLGMMYDKKMFFIGLPDARKLLKMRKGVTEIFIFINDIAETDRITAEIQSQLSVELNAMSFKEQLGDFYSTLSMMKSVYAFIEGLILFLASFVIINTMMMAIFERLREIGTMKALGMTDMELFLNFTCEGAIIGAAGGILGAVVGFILVMVVSHFGIDMSEQLKSMDAPIEYIIRPAVGFLELFVAMVISIVVPALAAMIPARYARKLMPAEALRK